MRLTEEKIKRIHDLNNQGLSNMKIALKMGISYWTIRYHLNKSYRESIKKSNKKRWERKKNEK